MTTMSIDANRPVSIQDWSARPALWKQQQALFGCTSKRIVTWRIGQVPGVAGRFVLALVPFSLLSWMFIAG